jgi:histidinol dehydrogenase
MVGHRLKSPLVGPPVTFGAPQRVTQSVTSVINGIRAGGDWAVRKCSEEFDNWAPRSFKLSDSEVEAIVAQVPQQTLRDIKAAQDNVRAFAQAQRDSIKDVEVEIQPGVFLGHRNNPIQTVGVYIPGGRYPLLASAHMTIVTAKVAGVEHVVACTPPINGEIPHATVAAASLAGADEIYILGGTQAIAAMAFGTETMRKVELIAGPGNAFVAEAKRQLFGEVGIDLLAGPTETLIVADEHADPFTVATDLLSQAEHGPDSPAVLITTSSTVGREAIRLVDEQLKTLSTAEVAEKAWRDHGQVVVVEDLEEAFELADEFASEHVQIFTQEPREALEKMKNYGALFLGEKTCVSYGDKVSRSWRDFLGFLLEGVEVFLHTGCYLPDSVVI